MLLVSIGTGTSVGANANLSPEEMNLLYNAASIPAALGISFWLRCRSAFRRKSIPLTVPSHPRAQLRRLR